MNTYLKLLTICFFSISLTNCQNKSAKFEVPVDNISKINNNRLAAEWEPAIGVMFTWPLHIPHKLVVEFAKDTKLFVLVENQSAQNEAEDWFTKWGIESSNAKFITAPQDVDASWVRDWGPHAIFNTNRRMKLGDGEYIYSTPISGLDCESSLNFIFTDEKGNIRYTKIDDQTPAYIANQLDIDLLELPFTFTGGNVLTDGAGTVFSTCIIKNENNYDGMPEREFLNAAKSMAGAHNYHLISNFEKRGIQHIDCFMKILDEGRMLVARTPKDHELYPIYEEIVQSELSQLKNIYGNPYKILRINTDRYQNEELAAYTNSLILNNNIYVPLFGIDQDSIALAQWREAMPGHKVKGFTFKIEDEPFLAKMVYDHYDNIGWTGGDALHCRTRALWEKEMLYISHSPQNNLRNETSLLIYAVVIDYSRNGLEENPSLKWRFANSEEWNTAEMKLDGDEKTYASVIPNPQNKNIEYYISAKSKSGSSEVNPRTAPKAFHTFPKK